MHVEYKNRSLIVAILMQIAVRIRFFFESWCLLKPFIKKDFNEYGSPYRPKDCPTIGYWETLGFKILWFLSALLRDLIPIAIIAIVSQTFAVLKFFHVRLEKRCIRKLEESGYDFKKNREIPIPEFDWENSDPQLLYENFIKRPHPVVLRGFMKGSKLLKEFKWDEVMNKYGDEDILVTNKEKDGFLGKLKDVNNPNLYIHNSEILFRKYKHIFNLIETERLEPYAGNMKAAYSQIFIGRYGTGSPLHAAGTNNFFYMIDGTKKWYFIDPNDSCFQYPFYHTGRAAAISFCLHPDVFEEETFPLMKYCPYYTATLNEGDVLFNPAWWFHSIKNISEKSVAMATRWYPNGIVGSNLRMTEEDYNISRMASYTFFFGTGSFRFLHEILRNPSPTINEHLTIREKKSRYVHNQYEAAYKPGLLRLGYRFTF